MNNKVCAVVCNRDEIFFEESIHSIVNYVDHVVIADCSENKDEALNSIEELEKIMAYVIIGGIIRKI